jgi:hypothetical protein
MSMLEIVEPAAQRRIQFDDNFHQTIPARALGPHPDAIVHGLKDSCASPSVAALRSGSPESQSPAPIADSLPRGSSRR